MHISIEVQGQDFPHIVARHYNEEEDDVTTLISDICETLDKSGKVYFRVSGFGQDLWRVDVRTDLPVLLEQLPEAIDAATNEIGSSFTLDFYEQGIERRLVFTPDGDEFVVRCESDTDWQPDPEEEKIKATRVRKMLLAIRDRFLTVARTAAPEIYKHEWLHDWAKRCRT